ncbi:UTP--glucose-1-phosphate uridylyltransferase [Synoicihabitans lomoniglobus]|uniref:UTP--glucose-1-phosphate uridylyltransferase n=1 Tax=Synoicihabitans lomoniglobus TaxID=2909285 RepID=A0AAF0CP37_9BACT|nr:UTP--glucose-1-phosphate uridylyltransferase [Opitutaceae bacterium LMO-M01]WED65541.1 UTP--glucose-1-phosphate uridylyltransferase [Opitutaceae bacterium LMO-M01]
MSLGITDIINGADEATRNLALDQWCEGRSVVALLAACEELESYRHDEPNLYHRVRALFFLSAIHRYHLPTRTELPRSGRVPYDAFRHLLERHFEEALTRLRRQQTDAGPSESLSSALAAGYHALAFQTLADQVRRTVRSTRGNAWMFRLGHPLDQPLKVRRELVQRDSTRAPFPLLQERTAVRMDLTHCAWSDIFFLGMDYPEGARVLNVSIDLGVHGRDASTRPPVEAYFRVIDEPVLRLASVDLEASVCISDLDEVFDFGRDYLGLLKAAVIAAGIVPPGIERSGASLADLLGRVFGQGRGFELVSSVNGIPKGSRLAVSTNLLGALIAACMRATHQIADLTGPMTENERRIVAARAILGEWIGGSGGGWQDSGGLWPGIKLIEGAPATDADAEYGISRGTLLPRHTLLGPDRIPASARQALQDSLVLVHGGMAQNVGPILEMATEKYLLRSAAAWNARQSTVATLDRILEALSTGDIKTLGAELTANFTGPLQTIIPWVSNRYTERLISEVRAEFGEDFWGFWMLGGMSGGGMGFIFAPARRAEAQDRLLQIMLAAKRDLESSLPFAMDPVVYDFHINENGSTSYLLSGDDALLPVAYYRQVTPDILRREARELTNREQIDLTQFTRAAQHQPEFGAALPGLLDRLLPSIEDDQGQENTLEELLNANGFDRQQHEQIRADLRDGRIGMALNRLPPTAQIEDVTPGTLFDGTVENETHRATGAAAIARGELAVVTYAAGVGSRWTQGAGVVKGLHPFAKFDGQHRSFIDVHLAKTRRVAHAHGATIPHVFTTSYLTHAPTETYLRAHYGNAWEREVWLSPGRSIGLRLVPTVRDLQFAWEETAQQKLDEQKEKMRDSVRAALTGWARATGEGADYTDNLPGQCLHPVGHWFEIPNLLKNGTLAALIAQQPNLRTLMVHNIDTLGATADPAMLGWFNAAGATLGWEMITKRIEDHGGGLARVDGKMRLVEGLALPQEEDESRLTYYNANTCWIDVDRLLTFFGLTRADLGDTNKTNAAVRRIASRLPTYVTIKEVKKRWGHGQEDVYPVTQFEKLWGDMTGLSDVKNVFAVVPRQRGQQLKDQAQLDGWQRDGSADYIASLCDW